MAKHNAANERVKQEYFEYLCEAKRLSTPSVDAAAKAISRFEESTGWRDLRSFHIKQVIAFKAKLSRQASRRPGEPAPRGAAEQGDALLHAPGAARLHPLARRPPRLQVPHPLFGR